MKSPGRRRSNKPRKEEEFGNEKDFKKAAMAASKSLARRSLAMRRRL